MTVITLDGTGLALEARPGESLTETFRRAGLMMRDGCLRGGCGMCRVRVVSGTITLSRTVCEQALPLADRDQGLTLACRAVPTSDVTVAIPPDGKLRCVTPLLTALARHQSSLIGDVMGQPVAIRSGPLPELVPA
ncbi:MAG: 2Fe-2S iron-sulfur cluster binding domain-containing protein [Propionibacteriaceae bacterium]|jgi:CDP-4-dehydro-6-deoxyglucose reductase|nr:2Fe-2S iron-sulfur cluster binding domain-containing protein [Propionibacteriaceae bacterium]